MARKPSPASATVSPLMEALRPGVQLLPAFVHLPAPRGRLGLRPALVLSQAYYMSKRSGGEWEYTPDDWKGTTGLSDDQLDRALRVLVQAGYLHRRQRSRVRVMAYSLDLQALEAALVSCAPITAKLRLCKTADSRPCKTADSRPSLIERGSFLRKEGEKRTPRKRAAEAPPPAPPMAAPGEERTRAAWMAYAAELSPAWVESKDAGKCWDLMESWGWEVKGRKVKDWKARARVLLGVWRDEKGGTEKEAKAGKLQAAKAAGEAAAQDARKRLERVQALAASEDWPGVVEAERLWRLEAPGTFSAYFERHRLPEWSRKIAAAAPVSRWKPGTPPRR